jgi:membrane protein implicated in regulation of membrane protease activity
MAVAWLVVGVLLLLVELHNLAFFALFVAIGCFAAAIVAWIFPDAIAAQALTCLAVSALGVWLVRPFVSRRFTRHGPGNVARGVHGGLVGQEAFTLDTVGDNNHAGHVRLSGERWLAVSGGTPIPPETPVVVTAVEGTTLTVWPVDGIHPPPPALPDQSRSES